VARLPSHLRPAPGGWDWEILPPQQLESDAVKDDDGQRMVDSSTTSDERRATSDERQSTNDDRRENNETAVCIPHPCTCLSHL
jgi:hypothetical protein